MILSLLWKILCIIKYGFFFKKVILKVYVKKFKFNSKNYNLIVRDDV